jgi:hypothetical protein
MGEGSIYLVALELDKLTEHIVTLKEAENTDFLGRVVLGLRLVPKLSDPGDTTGSITSHIRSGSIGSFSQFKAEAGGVLRSGKRHPWSAVVNVVLVEGKDLKAMDLEGTSDPYCKVR